MPRESRWINTSIARDGTQHLDTCQTRPSSKHTCFMDDGLLPCWFELYGEDANMNIVAGLIWEEDWEAYRDEFIEFHCPQQQIVSPLPYPKMFLSRFCPVIICFCDVTMPAKKQRRQRARCHNTVLPQVTTRNFVGQNFLSTIRWVDQRRACSFWKPKSIATPDPLRHYELASRRIKWKSHDPNSQGRGPSCLRPKEFDQASPTKDYDAVRQSMLFATKVISVSWAAIARGGRTTLGQRPQGGARTRLHCMVVWSLQRGARMW